MARVTVEDCIDKVKSPYELVLVAKERATQLNSGIEPTVDRDNDKNTVIALREIANTTIPIEQMKEDLIEEYQTITIRDEEEENMELELLKNEETTETQNKETLSDSSTQIEEEIKDLTLAEESDLEKKLEMSEESQSSKDISSAKNDEQESNS